MYGGSLPRKLPRQNNQNSSITAFKYADAQDIGMASNKMSIVIIFGHKYFKQRFDQKISHIFTKYFVTKKCYLSSTSNILLFDFYSSLSNLKTRLSSASKSHSGLNSFIATLLLDK